MTFPARSIIALAYCGGECGGEACPAVVIGCDCGTTTHLTVEVPETGKYQAAFTCDGCTSVNWFTVTREDPRPASMLDPVTFDDSPGEARAVRMIPVDESEDDW